MARHHLGRARLARVSAAVSIFAAVGFNIATQTASSAAGFGSDAFMNIDGSIRYVANTSPPPTNQFGWANSGTTYGTCSSPVASVKLVSGSTMLTVASGGFPDVSVGQTITGTGIPSGTIVVGVSGDTVIMSAAATAGATESVTFAGGVDAIGSNGIFNCGGAGFTAGHQPNPPGETAAALSNSSIINAAFETDATTNEATATCPADTRFQDGQKFGASGTSLPYAISDSSLLSKDDLTDAYAVARHDTISGDEQLYLGGERLNDNGDSFLGFEFLQAGASVSGGCNGSLNITRSQGDVAINFNFVGGGTTSSPVIFLWNCGTTPATPQGQPCAGNVGTYVQQTTPPLSQAETTSNNTATACGGWICEENGGVSSATGVGANEFSEAALDLTGLGLAGNCLGTMLAESKSSQSLTADMKDFVTPVPFSTCPSTTTTTPTPVVTGATNLGDSWTDQALVQGNSTSGSPAGTVTFFECSPTVLAGATSCNSTIGTQIGSPVDLTANTTPADSSSATSASFTPNAAGTWCFAGYYSGDDGKYTASADTSADECFLVGQAPTTTTTTASAGITLNPSNSISDSATVDSSGGVPLASTDTVQFYRCHVSNSTGVVAACPNVPGNAFGAPVSITGTPPQTVSSGTFTPVAVGSYCFSAVFSGDTNYAGSSDNTTGSGVAAECTNVSPASTATNTQTSGDVTLSPTATASDSATVSSTGGVPFASGDTVQFYLCHVSTSTGVVAACPNIPGNIFGSAVSITGTPPQTVNSTTFMPTAAGSYCFGAVFSGDANYLGSTDNTSGSGVANECFNVNPASTTTGTVTSGSVTLSPTGSVNDAATVSSSGGVPFASGDTVQFYFCKVSNSTGVVAACPNVPGNALGSPVSITGTPPQTVHSISQTPTSVGSYCFGAVFSGDANYLGSSDNTSGSGVAAECLSVNPAPTSTSTATSGDVTLSPTDTVTDSATVDSGGGVPFASGDTVQFYLCKVSGSIGVVASCPNIPGNALGTAVPITGTPPQTVTSENVNPTSVGSYCFGAVFSGDSNYQSSSDNTSGSGVALECFNVNQAPTTTSTITTGDVTLSPTGSASDSATVDSSGGVPFGSGDTVQFYLCHVSSSTGVVATCANTSGNIFGSPVSIGGTPPQTVHSTSFTATAVGSYCFGAVFSGDSNYASSTDNVSGTPVAAECFNVSPAPTTTTTTASGDVVLGPTGSATDSAMITSGATVPFASGDTVQFYVCKVSGTTGVVGSCPNVPGNALGSPVSVTGSPPQTVGSTSFTPTSVGSYCFSAVFSGDTNYLGSSDNTTGSGVAAECFNASAAPTTTTTTASGSVTLSPTGSATDSALVTSPGTVPFSSGDTVQFYVCKVSGTTGVVGSCANVPGNALGSAVPITGTPPQTVGSTTFTPTSVGSYCFSAVFSGDNNYEGSSDNTTGSGVAAECFNVNPAPTTTTTTASGDVVLSPTGSATDTATVASGGGVPFASGDTVQFYLCHVSDSTGVVAACANIPANVLGSPTPITGTPPQMVTSTSFTAVTVGSYCFSAVFSGDTNYVGSSDNTTGDGVAAECFNVTPAPTTTTTTASGSVTLSPTGSATDSAMVTSGATVPFGSGDTVQFYVCKVSGTTGVVGACPNVPGNALGSAVSITGTPPQTVGSISFTPTSVGSYCFSAVFSGDSNYLGSTDNTTGDGVAAECFSVSPASTTTTTVTSGDVNLNPTGTATDSATVDSGGGVPFGSGDTVQFYLCHVSDSTGVVASCANIPANVQGSPVPISGTPPQTVSSAVFTPTAVGSYCFSAVFSGDSNYLGSTDNTTGDGVAAECFSVTQPSFTVTKAVNPSSGTAVTPGATLTYTLTVSNVGSGPGTAAISDAAPTNTTLVAGSAACGTPVPAGGSCSVTSSTGTLGWSVTLAGGTSMTVTFQVTVDATDTATIFNTGSFTGPGCTTEGGCSTNQVNNPVMVLSAVKSSVPPSGSTVGLGTTVTYGIKLSNAGTGTITGVTVTDGIPNGTTYVAGSASCGGVPGCTVAESGGTVTWSSVTIAGGASNAVTLTFQVTVNASDTNGEVIPNFAVFTNVGTPGCTGTTCNTNTVTLTVALPPTIPASSTTTVPPVIPAVTTVHTGKPWAGSGPIELLALVLGIGLITIGEFERRRARRILAEPQDG